MFLQFPDDTEAQTAAVEDQYMFGDKWLVGPVYTEGVKSRSIYLPPLPSNQTWVYYFNYSEVRYVRLLNACSVSWFSFL